MKMYSTVEYGIGRRHIGIISINANLRFSVARDGKVNIGSLVGPKFPSEYSKSDIGDNIPMNIDHSN